MQWIICQSIKHYSYTNIQSRSNLNLKIVEGWDKHRETLSLGICDFATTNSFFYIYKCSKWGVHLLYINSCSPSRDKASRMPRQAVARSAMDCHSSSVESVVSERTERKRSRFNGTIQQKSGDCRLLSSNKEPPLGDAAVLMLVRFRGRT